MDDPELLREYVDRESEEAFTELVARHINLVYSTALRTVQEPALAKDVSQSVFIQLARKAPVIRDGHLLSGWLYRVTHCQAVNAVRAERTRRRHESEAMNLTPANDEPSAVWEAIAPHIEEAMRTLKDVDQNAVVQRFFQGRSWREVGATLALSEDAAQKRVSRAIEKLRAHLLRQGVVASTVVLGSAIAANAVQAAPAGLSSTVASASLAAAAGVGSLGHHSTFVQTLLMKKTTYAMLSAALVGAISIPILVANANDSQPVTEASLRQGLVLHFPFDQPETGGEVTDTSGAYNHGRVVGAEWTRDPQRGGAFKFAPPNQYIRVPNSDSLNPPQISLAAWIQTSNQDDTWRRVMDKSWTDGYALSMGGGHTPGNRFQGKAVIEIAMKINKQRSITSSDKVLTDGEWHHLVTTYDGAEGRIYVDGVLQERIARWSGIVPKNSWDLTIGINLVDPNPEYNEVGASFDGLIDEPMIFNRALSPKEVRFLFDSQRR